jgi:hypothetical protein
MLQETLISINKEIRKYKEKYSEFLNQKKEELVKLSEITSELYDPWGKSWFGVYSSLYFINFDKPPLGCQFNLNNARIFGLPNYWIEQSYEDVASHIESKSNGLSIKQLESEIKPLMVHIKEIQNLLTTDLIIIQSDAHLQNEWELIRKVEEHRWGTSVATLNYIKMPKEAIVDLDTAQMGMRVPPHILYENEVLVELSKIQSIEEFLRAAEKITRQIELKMKYNIMQDQKNHVDTIVNIFSKFLSISRQLRNRHDKRPTIEIEDEYDVQDLLHALLKLHFDDIRPEEWTPSYAGSSSRMDFLLKKEKIVIEVKKTRKGLEDKQVGEQLIVDIARYESHQDCKTLICFVYDPEGRVGNPSGLENDLNQRCTEEMNVITIIEPKS